MARKKSLASWVSLYKTAKIKPLKLRKARKTPKIKMKSYR